MKKERIAEMNRRAALSLIGCLGFSTNALAQVCPNVVTVRSATCPGGLNCDSKGAALNTAEFDQNMLNVAYLCDNADEPAGGGSVTSVALTVPSWLAVTGSPITISGTLAISAASGQTAGRVIGTCGAATSFGVCALVDSDIPNSITVDLATLATTATTANAGDSATAFFSSGAIEAARLPDLSGLNGAVTDAQVPDTITKTGTANKCAHFNASGVLEAATGDCASGDTGGVGSITIEEVDAAPSIAGATKLKIDQADGLVLTDEGSGIARLDLSGGSSAWTTIKKTSDEGRDSTITLANDGALTLAMNSGSTYVVRGFVFYNTAATPDFKYGFVGPTGTLVFHQRNYTPGGGTMGFGSNGIQAAYPTNQALTGNAGVGMVEFYLRIAATSTTTFAFQWAQNVSDAASTTVYAGSYLEWMTP